MYAQCSALLGGEEPMVLNRDYPGVSCSLGFTSTALRYCLLSPGLGCLLDPWHKEDYMNPQSFTTRASETVPPHSAVSSRCAPQTISFCALALPKHCNSQLLLRSGNPFSLGLLPLNESKYKPDGAQDSSLSLEQQKWLLLQ